MLITREQIEENYNSKNQLFINIKTLEEYSFGTWQDIMDKGGMKTLIGGELDCIYNQDLILHQEPRESARKELRPLKEAAYKYLRNKKPLIKN